MKLLVIVALLAAGCQSTKAKAVTGTALSALGGGLLITADQGNCSDMELSNAIDCGVEETGQLVLGTLILGAGLTALLAAAISAERDDKALAP